jgi:hypothetical protein
MGYYRYLHNNRVKESQLIQALQRKCAEQVADKDLLVLQDTTQTNYEWNRSQIRPQTGLGLGSDNSSLGYFLHPSLVLDADQGLVKGLGSLTLWSRPEGRVINPRDQRREPIESKESFRWIWEAIRSKAALSRARSVTVVQDREGDQYESFVRLSQAGIGLLTHCRINRRLEGGQKLYAELEGQSAYLNYKLIIRDNPKRTSRVAHMELRYAPVVIQSPKRLKRFGYPPSIAMYGILAEEKAHSAPKGETPIRWVLLCTHPIEDFATALKIVQWYTWRWLIEELFRILKIKGFNIERAELKEGWALRKLGIMTAQESVRVLQLKQVRNGNIDQPIEVVFDPAQQACLSYLNEELQGNTEKQRNPYPKKSLAWACWIIARLGGWTPYEKNRPPGVITLKNGLDKFDLIFFGWKAQYDTS